MENQLLENYSDTEKGAYLGAIASIASADRVASEQEIEFLNMLSLSAGLSPEAEQAVIGAAKDSSNISIQKCLDVLKASDLRFSFITDIMSFAKADGKLDAEEQSRINQMAQYLGINQEQVGALQQFVSKAEEAQQNGENPTDESFLQKTGLANMFGQAGIPSGGLMKGLLGILAPMVISKVLSGRQGGGMGSMGSGGGGMLGGLLGSVLGGGSSMGGGLGGNMGSGGGLGSLMGVLGGLGGQRGYNGGGLGSILGSVLGGGGQRTGW